MLNSISWAEYLKAILIIVAAYYAITILLLYSKEIKEKLLKNKNHLSPDETETNENHSDSDAVIGNIREVDHVIEEQGLLSSDQIQVAGGNGEIGYERHSTSEPIADVTELLDQAKALTMAIANDNPTKEDTLELIKGLLSRFPQFRSSKYQDAIELFLHNNLKDLPIAITITDLKSLW
jgi:hypothetical protein